MLEKKYIKGISHIGIAVQDIDVARKLYELLGYEIVNEDIIGEKEYGVRVQMMKLNDQMIELLEPYEKGKESPIDKYISTKPYKMYHLAYVVSDIYKQIEYLEKNKFIKIDEPKPSNCMNGKLAVFMFNRNMGIIELIEEERHG